MKLAPRSPGQPVGWSFADFYTLQVQAGGGTRRGGRQRLSPVSSGPSSQPKPHCITPIDIVCSSGRRPGTTSSGSRRVGLEGGHEGILPALSLRVINRADLSVVVVHRARCFERRNPRWLFGRETPALRDRVSGSRRRSLDFLACRSLGPRFRPPSRVRSSSPTRTAVILPCRSPKFQEIRAAKAHVCQHVNARHVHRPKVALFGRPRTGPVIASILLDRVFAGFERVQHLCDAIKNPGDRR